MAMSPMMKWQKEIERNRESAKLKKQKRRDYKDLRNSGIYEKGRDHYLDKDGHYRDGIEIPVWFRNLQRAWQANHELAAKRHRNQIAAPIDTKSLEAVWNDYCDEKVSMLGYDADPRKPKRKVGRPKLLSHLKKSPGKIKRSDQMKQLLMEHGVNIKSVGQDEFLVEQPDWEFLPNGRLRYMQESPVSCHQFLRDQDLVPM